MLFFLAVIFVLAGAFLVCIGHPWLGLSETVGGLGWLKFLVWSPFVKSEEKE